MNTTTVANAQTTDLSYEPLSLEEEYGKPVYQFRSMINEGLDSFMSI